MVVRRSGLGRSAISVSFTLAWYKREEGGTDVGEEPVSMSGNESGECLKSGLRSCSHEIDTDHRKGKVDRFHVDETKERDSDCAKSSIIARTKGVEMRRTVDSGSLEPTIRNVTSARDL